MELEKCLDLSNKGDYYDVTWCKWNVQFIFQLPPTLLRAEEIINQLVDRKWIKHLMVVLKFENWLLLLVLDCFKWNILGVLDNTCDDWWLKSANQSLFPYILDKDKKVNQLIQKIAVRFIHYNKIICSSD